MQENEGKKKERYEKPEIEIIYLDDVDIITTSGENQSENETRIMMRPW